MHAGKVSTYLTVITGILCQHQDLKIKIALPEFICAKDGSVKDISNDMTTMRLIGKDVQTVNYEFVVNFKRIGNDVCRNNQRCTLLTWRAVRELNDYLKKYPIKDGLIQINNTMFLPGIQYIVSVKISNSAHVIEEKVLTMDYIDDNVMKSTTKPMASLLLLAGDNTYAFTQYVINVETTICSNISHYHYRWELFDETGTKSVEKFYEKSPELTIPPYTLIGLKSYSIKCDLIDMATGISIANTSQNINVLSRGFRLNLPVRKITAGVNQSLRINAAVSDLDNTETKPNLNWACKNLLTNDNCDDISTLGRNATALEFDRFPSECKYNFTLEVTQDNLKPISSYCIVDVLDNIPFIEINDEFENVISPSNEQVNVEVIIRDLITTCTIQWTSPNEPGYEPLDLKIVPGKIDEILNVTVKEDLFLQELDEFTANTIDKPYNLLIPPPSKSWNGLRGDANYLFRLIVTCPLSAISNEANNDAITEPLIDDSSTFPNKVVTADIEIKTNSPPEIGNFDVSPEEGEAFLTSFTFKAQNVRDKSEDGPILYKFGYQSIEDDGGSKDFILKTLSDVTSTEVTLPYRTDGILTFLQVCDNLNACNKMSGPKIITNLPKNGMNHNYFTNLLRIFTEKLNTEDYYKSLLDAISILELFRNLNDSQNLKDTEDFFTSKIDSEIEKWTTFKPDNLDNDKWIDSPNSLISNLNQFSAELQLPESSLSNLGKLRDKISEVTSVVSECDPDRNPAVKMRKILSLTLHDNVDGTTVKRSKRSPADIGNEIKRYIGISELIITTSNSKDKIIREKQTLLSKLHNYMRKLCQNSNKSRIQLEFKTLVLSIEKINKNSLNSYIFIPSEQNSFNSYARVKFGKNSRHPLNYCVGKIMLKGYLNIDDRHVFKIDIFDDKLEPVVNTNLNVLLPLELSGKRGEPKCAIFLNDAWGSNSCNTIKKSSHYVQCSCNRAGYYTVNYEKVIAPTISTSTSTASLLSVTKIEATPIDIPSSSRKVEPVSTESPSVVDSLINDTINATSRKLSHGDTTADNNYETASYVVIAGSIIGSIVIIAFVLHISHREDDTDETDNFSDFPKYAHLYDEEMLNDAHI